MIFLTDAVKWSWGQAWLRQYTGELFHAILTDPPYHLTSINERFSGENSAPAKFGKDGAFGRLSRGFMGQAWDGGGVSFDPHTWAGFAECLHPGGFIVSFGGSRTYHRIAVAMEEAGLIIHPFLFVYAFATGFPKATRIRDNRQDVPQFNGHRYGLQALKPAIEPIIVAQKPYTGRPVDCITSTGAGAWNIEAGRIGTEKAGWGGHPSQGYCGGLDNYEENGRPANGRWPSNLILEHTSECQKVGTRQIKNRSGNVTGEEPSPKTNNVYGEMKNQAFERYGDGDGYETVNEWLCPEYCPVRLLGEMSGESISSGGVAPIGEQGIYGVGGKGRWFFNDSGTAARYFFQADFAYDIAERLADANPLFYTAKPGDNEREAGLEDLPDSVKHRVNSGGLENEPRFAPVKAKNIHPTVKPLSLTKYLAGLLLPPPEYSPRRILVPFCGSGSEMIGAMLAGWDEVIGLEITPEYVPIAEARLKWWGQWIEWGQTDIDKILKAEKPSPNQKTLF